MNDNEMDNKIKNSKRQIILGIVFSFIVLLGSSYAIYRYLRTLNAVGITNKDIRVTYTGGNNYINFNNAYPISDSYAISNLSSLEFVDFSLTGNQNNQNVTYEIFVTENNGNDLNSSFIKLYLTDENNNVVSGPVNYSDLTNTSYRNERNNGKLIFKGKLIGNETKNYKLYAWLDSSYEDNSDSRSFGFYVNVFAYIESTSNLFSERISELISNNVNYISEYTGNSNDTYNNRGNETIYYFKGNNAKANSNVLFAGYCWQIIRTTDNGGVKLLYNGVAENNQCKTDRTIKKGINGSGDQTISDLNTTTTYGTGFTYTENGFTLTGVVTNKTWSTDYKDLIGMYTCKGNNVSCTTISQIVRYESNTSAKGATYTIGTLQDKYTIGTSPFNGSYESPTYVGYMYNRAYIWKEGVKENVYYGNDVSYNGNTYTLKGTTTETQSNPDDTHHYVCDNTDTTTCSKVRYYITLNNNVYRYITLENGETIEDALYNMINYKSNQNIDANINVYNSSMKAYLESWYSQNLSSYSASIDTSTTYCNERTVTSLGGWNKNGNLGSWLNFINISTTRPDLSCPNTLDKFSVENNNAKLKYPIGLITEPERNIMAGAAGDGVASRYYWGSSPFNFYNYYAGVRVVDSAGGAGSNGVDSAYGARPVITLSSNTSYSEGDGSYESPYVVGDKVRRTIS